MNSSHLLLLGAGWTKPDWAWIPFSKYASSRGYDTLRLDYPHRGFAPIQYSARKARNQIQDIIKEYPQVTYIGHSMGGLIGRYLIQRMDMYEHISSYVSLATPHHGTYAAYCAPWSHSAKQMRPRSAFLSRLNDTPWPSHVRALSIRGGLEEVVLPRKNAKFRHAEDLVVPKSDHLSLVVDPRMWRLLLEWLQEPELPDQNLKKTEDSGSKSPLPAILPLQIEQ